MRAKKAERKYFRIQIMDTRTGEVKYHYREYGGEEAFQKAKAEAKALLIDGTTEGGRDYTELYIVYLSKEEYGIEVRKEGIHRNEPVRIFF